MGLLCIKKSRRLSVSCKSIANFFHSLPEGTEYLYGYMEFHEDADCFVISHSSFPECSEGSKVEERYWNEENGHNYVEGY